MREALSRVEVDLRSLWMLGSKQIGTALALGRTAPPSPGANRRLRVTRQQRAKPRVRVTWRQGANPRVRVTWRQGAKRRVQVTRRRLSSRNPPATLGCQRASRIAEGTRRWGANLRAQRRRR
jgi:hypothetical protein